MAGETEVLATSTPQIWRVDETSSEMWVPST